MLIRVNFGANLDLEFLKDFPIVDYAFDILNDDCTDYDFSESEGVFFNLYAKKNGKLIISIEMGLDSPTTNRIYLNSDDEITGERAKEYYHIVYSVVDGNNIVVFQGISILT